MGPEFAVGGGATAVGADSGPDRRHAVEVARETIRLLDEGTPPQEGSLPREVVAAALLHDVGKVESGLGTFARVGVTLAAMGAGRTRLLGWAGASPGSRPTWRARISMYLTHDRLGAELLQHAGSNELTTTWAREHHLSPACWTVDKRVAAALKEAGGD